MTVLVARPIGNRQTAGQRQSLVAVSHTRLMMLMLVFAAAVSVVVGRLVLLAIFSCSAAEARVATLAA
ncbi:MAG TPA: penicillin-binding protein 2, partial [Sphingomonas sp.]